MTFDVAVLGGGPAGTAAAITAARGGARVVLLERGSFPREKVCGEFVSAEALALLSTLVTDDAWMAEHPRIDRLRIFATGRHADATLRPAGCSIARTALDDALWRSAANAGVTALTASPVLTITGAAPWTVVTAARAFTAHAVIDASGRWSALRASPLPTGTGWLGLKAHFLELAPPPGVDLYFFRGGYCGVQLVGPDRINVCAMVRADIATRLEQVFLRAPELRLRSRNWRRGTPVVATAPLLFRAPVPVYDGILRVGDAAGFIDPFAGDGISLALHSGTLAAHSLLPFFCGKESLVACASRYARSYSRHLLPAFRAAAFMRSWSRWPAPVQGVAVRLLGNSVISRHVIARTRLEPAGL